MQRTLFLLTLAAVTWCCGSSSESSSTLGGSDESEFDCMATEQTENATNADFENGLSVPETGDSFNTTCNATLPALFQQVGDRFQALRNGVPGVAASATIWIPMAASINVSSRFTAALNFNAMPGYSQTSIADVGNLVFDISQLLPQTGKIDAVTAIWSGNGGHSAEPATKPIVTLYSYVTPWSAETSVATGTDPYTNDATYDAVHEFGPSSIAHTIDPAKRYAVRFRGETGANAVTGSFLYGIRITVTP